VEILMALEPDRVRQQLDRILASSSFVDAGRSSGFLRFVVEKELAGQGAEIKEYSIGVEVLGRSDRFDPRTDPIVRVEASRLRTRLTSYYQSEGARDPVLIDLPKGGYTPEFQPRTATGNWRAELLPWIRKGLLAMVALAVLVVAWRLVRRPETPAETLRLSVLPPPGHWIHSSAISPDGRWIAFAAISGGKATLWVRALGADEAHVMAGTEGASYPFWSPDSRLIGFFGRDALKKIPVTGGPAQTISSAMIGRGGAWSRAGVIIFAPIPLGPLYRVPSGGGRPEPVTTLDADRREIGHVWPQFLPDQQHFLYHVTSESPGDQAVRIGSLDGKTSKIAVNTDSSGVYAAPWRGHPGRLLFAHRGALLAQPFDANRLEITGERTVILPQVWTETMEKRAEFSVSNNGVLTYIGGSPLDRKLAWVDRDGRTLREIGSPNDFYALNLAPDGKRLLLNSNDVDNGIPGIWMMDLERGTLSRITSGKVSFFPVWSSDGTRLVYSAGNLRSRPPEIIGMDVMLVRADTSVAPDPLTNDAGNKFVTGWSSDGRYLLYYTLAHGTNYDIWTLDLKSHEQRPVLQTEFSEAGATFRPEPANIPPKWMAYVSNESGNEEVYIRSFPDGAGGKWRVSDKGGSQPRWRADGRELFYLSHDGFLTAVDIRTSSGLRPGAPRPLFPAGIRLGYIPEPPYSLLYAVSADGSKFLVNRATDDSTLRAITVVIGGW
jgi:eukaryotic-like serine/threonine-protein kinase